jgi:hypothetical protein
VPEFGRWCQNCTVTDQRDVILVDRQLLGVSPGFNEDDGSLRCLIDGRLDGLSGVDMNEVRVPAPYYSLVLGSRTS